MKGGLKALGIVGAILGLMLFFAWIGIEDESLDNSLENIDDTKFPISDYLYFEKPLEPTQPQNDYLYNNTPNNSDANNQSNAPTNPFENNESDKEQQDKTDDSKDIKDGFNIANLFNETIDKASKLGEETFEEEIDEEVLRQRESLLATRTGNITILSKNKNEVKLSIEYGVNKFSNLDEQDKASNEHKLYRTISAIKMIPAVLLTNISSDIGGKCIAQVEEDIYAEMGKAILIPKGSKILGNYASNNKISEFRLNVLWTRILTPQGVNIMLTDSYGADLAGAMGIIGDLDSKYW